MKTTTKYSEIENKYDGSAVEIKDFDSWAKSLKPFSCKHVVGHDSYYRQGRNVVRHRYNGSNYNALTVKCRKSRDSIQDRVEVDLFVDGGVEDAEAFLATSGFNKEFTIWKDAYIYHVDDGGVEVSLVIYDIKVMDGYPTKKFLGKTLRYIEVEVEKSSHVSVPSAKRVLSRWDKALKSKFGVKSALKSSLYEIFSARRYKIVEKARG